jgi:phage tail-like protein
MAGAQDPDPWGNFYFALEVNGTEVAHFTECSGMKTSAEVFTIQEGGLNGRLHSRPGPSKWENIVLKRATNVSSELLRWRDEYVQDKYTTRANTSGAIVIRANSGEELRRYNFVSAFPVAWEGPSLNAGGSELAIETLEIAHEGIYVDGEGPPPPQPPPPTPIPERLDLGPVQFEYDSAELTDEGKSTVANAAEQLDAMEIEDIWVEGHTCTMGSFAYNQSLSSKRAHSVVTELKAQSSNSNRRYYSLGFAWKYPVGPNNSSGGKSANRRTEFMTTSFAERGVNADSVSPESRKYSSPWFHT